MAKEIKDFGQKIGGARKDVWKESGLTLDDFASMNEREAEKYVTKANIWPKPDYQAMVDNGVPYEVVYFRKIVRDATAATLKGQTHERQERYIEAIRELKELVDQVEEIDEIPELFNWFFVFKDYLTISGKAPYFRFMATEKGNENPIITTKLLRAVYIDDDRFANRLRNEALRKGFLQKKEDGTPTRKPRKKQYVPPQLKNVKREGPDYRNGKNATGEDYIATFGFRGGEFGNWLNQTDRQESMNMAYDALLDLASAIGIANSDISLNGELAIAFGSRGRANSAAHYEPLRKVINLTKMHGAGALAHEWWHALDDFLGEKLAGKEKYFTGTVHPLAKKLVATMAMKKEPDGLYHRTDYDLHSSHMDLDYGKTEGCYWKDPKEMAARAFSCYIMDKLDFRSDYLVGSSEVFFTKDNEPVFPVGEEREAINTVFDEIIEVLKTEVLSES